MKILYCAVLLSAISTVLGIRFKGVNQFLGIERTLYKFTQHPVERQRVVSSADAIISDQLFRQQNEKEGSSHSRHRRTIHNDYTDANSKIETSNMTFQEDHNLAFIAWSGKTKSDTIVTLFRDYTITSRSTSSVYVSHDYGKTYRNLTGLFKNESGINVRLDGFIDSPDDYRDYIFVSQEDKALFTSQDEARTFHYHKLSFTPSDIITHPYNGSILVAYDMTDHQAYISLDFGEHWKPFSGLFPSESIGGVYWGAEFGQNSTIYVATEQSNGLFNIYKTDLDLSHKFQMFTYSVHEFDIASEYMYAVRIKTDAANSKALLVSFDGGSFLEAAFSSIPDDPLARLVERSYYVADGSEGQLVVAVNHQYNLTNLYISESQGVRFSLSLERVLYHDPNLTDISSSWVYRVRNTKLLDFHKAGGLRGIYIATQLTIGTVGGRYLNTYISYDKGGEWSRLTPPTRRYDNRTITCNPPDCYLNLASEFSSIYRTYKTEPILSKPSTPGLIMATGSVGKNLYVYGDLMVSNTAGASWISSLPGFNYYQFGDNGGFMIATPKYYHGRKNYIYYSLDEGRNWQKYTFSQQSLLIWGLLTEPGEYTTEVALYGSETYYQSHFEWVVVRIDMKRVLGAPCTEDSYYQWSPSDDIPNRGCLLGSMVRYQRKKFDVQCLQGLNFTRNTSSQLCTCTRIDYECDFGYDLEDTGNSCHSTGSLPTIPSACYEGGTYPRSRGYRKIAGDKCTGDDNDYSPVWTPCPGQVSHFHLDVSGAGTTHDAGFYSVPDRTEVVITAHLYNQSQYNPTYLWWIDNKAHSSGSSLTYTFTEAKTYIVSLTISSQTFSASNSTLITVLDQIDPTQFSIHGPSYALMNQITQVSVMIPAAVAKYGPLTFKWVWDDNNKNNQAVTSSLSQSINFKSVGTHQVCLTVMNAISTSTLPNCPSIQVYPSLQVTGLKLQYMSASIQLEWNPPSPISIANYYTVVDVSQCSPTLDLSQCCSTQPACCPAGRIIKDMTAAYQSVILSALAGNYSYKLVVVARNSDKSYCTHSSVYQTTTDEGLPGPPSLYSGSQSVDGVALMWSPPMQPNGMVTGYQVVSYVGSMPVLNTQSSHFSGQTAQMQNLWPGVMYSFYVEARTSKGYGMASTRPLNVFSPSTSTLSPIIFETSGGQLASRSPQELECYMRELSNSISNLGDVFSPVMLSNYSIAFLFKSNPKQSRSVSDVSSAVLAALKGFSYDGITIMRAYNTKYATVENAIATPVTPTTQAVITSRISSLGFVFAWVISIIFNIFFIILIFSLCFSLYRTNKLRKQRYAVLTNFNAEDEEVTVNDPLVQAENLMPPPSQANPYSVELDKVVSENDDDPMLDVNTDANTPLLS